MATTSITGSAHPLTKHIFELDQAHRAERRRWAHAAGQILADHRQNGTSDQSVYRVEDVDGSISWARVGSHEQCRHLLGPGYLAVTGRDPVDEVITRIVGSGRTRCHDLHHYATVAAPMVGALLAMLVDAGLMEWDTDETVTQAGLRLGLDAAWRRRDPLTPGRPLLAPSGLYAAAVDDLGLTGEYQDAAGVARWWLEHRGRVVCALAAQGIEFGASADLLGGTAAADRAGVTRGTWGGYVSRGEAPGGDTQAPARWLPATVDAWRLTRPRVEWLAW
jgi:hypothetical protein